MGVVMISRRNVGDFDSWKTRFEAQAADRAEYGSVRVRRFQGRAFVAKKMAERPGLVDELDFFFARELPTLES